LIWADVASHWHWHSRGVRRRGRNADAFETIKKSLKNDSETLQKIFRINPESTQNQPRAPGGPLVPGVTRLGDTPRQVPMGPPQHPRDWLWGSRVGWVLGWAGLGVGCRCLGIALVFPKDSVGSAKAPLCSLWLRQLLTSGCIMCCSWVDFAVAIARAAVELSRRVAARKGRR
jgi:hypothetical protein